MRSRMATARSLESSRSHLVEPSTPLTTSRSLWQPSGINASTRRERPVCRTHKPWRQREVARPASAMKNLGWQARARHRMEERAEMRAETESHSAWRSEVWTDEDAEETVYWRKKMADARAKKRSGGKGRRWVVSDRKMAMERTRKRKRTAADCREVKRWTGVRPLRSGSASEETRIWWTKAIRRQRMRK